jgi:hypothetical protein
VFGATFGCYPSYVFGILNSVKHIHFYVLCKKRINYTEYIKNILRKMYTFKLRTINYFVLTSGKEKVLISFQSTCFRKMLPSVLIFTQSVLKIQLSSLSYSVVCINKSLTLITNDTLTSRHECILDMSAFYLNVPRRLANCIATSVAWKNYSNRHISCRSTLLY